MIRFAFNPNESSRQRLAKLKENGVTYAFSALLEPLAIKKQSDGAHKKFKYEQEILDLLQVIDGSKDDEELLGFLNYDKIKDGKMCRHIVIVLPYCASCDALEKLIKTHAKEFKNLNEYEIINISGVDQPQKYKTPESIKSAIESCEDNGQKTITLTVNRMLTGSTVPQWDTMLYLKDTASPQEYDQAIFRLQNQCIKVFKDEDGNEIKFNMKPQTLLVDFMPDRMFRMQEQKSQIYNVNTDESGNTHLKDRLTKELSISPIIVLNKDKLVQVNAGDILNAVSEYSQSRGVADEVVDIPVDLSLLENEDVRRVIENENALGSKEGLSTKAHQGDGEGDDIDTPNNPSTPSTEEGTEDNSDSDKSASDKDDTETRIKQFRTFYSRILFFAFLTKTRVASLSDVIACIDESNNTRIVDNLGIDRQALVAIQNMNWAALRTLDYKIQNINTLSRDHNADPLKRCEVAIKKFGKLSEAEIVTPAHICSEMVNLIPDNEWQRIIDNGDKILDIASKVGEFAVAICSKLKYLGYQSDQFKNSILAIPTSTVAYEFTRRIYEELGLDLSCLVSNFTAYDLLDIKNDSGKIDYPRICRILKQNTPFNSITLADTVNEGEEKVNIEAVIGNPPYQENTLRTSDNPIYHNFLDIGYGISPICCFITPAKFLFNVGKTPKQWNQKMLDDEYLKVAHCEMDCSKIFEGLKFEGGVAVTYRDLSVKTGGIKAFTPYPILNKILSKVHNSVKGKTLENIIYLQNKFNLDILYTLHPEYRICIGSNGQEKRLTTSIFETINLFSYQPHSASDIRILGLDSGHRTFRFIPAQYLEVSKNLKKYKVVLPKSNGSGAIGKSGSTALIGEPEILKPNDGFTQSFISIGAFDSLFEASSACKYIKSKFARALLGILKVTQDNNKEVWKFVPMQDFTTSSDIDWSVSAPEIDQQLYKKYGLSTDEINFIETAIKPME